MTPSQEIRKIWEEMQKLKFMQGREPNQLMENRWYREKAKLEEKYEETNILFGRESTLSKAIIYYLDSKK
jgi:hypothetical protein